MNAAVTPELALVIEKVAAKYWRMWFKDVATAEEVLQISYILLLEKVLPALDGKDGKPFVNEMHRINTICAFLKRRLRWHFLDLLEKRATDSGYPIDDVATPVPEDSEGELFWQNLSAVVLPGQRKVLRKMLGGQWKEVVGNARYNLYHKILTLYPTPADLRGDTFVRVETDSRIDLALLRLMRGDATISELEEWVRDDLGKCKKFVASAYFTRTKRHGRPGVTGGRSKSILSISAEGFKRLQDLTVDDDYTKFLSRQASHRDSLLVTGRTS